MGEGDSEHPRAMWTAGCPLLGDNPHDDVSAQGQALLSHTCVPWRGGSSQKTCDLQGAGGMLGVDTGPASSRSRCPGAVGALGSFQGSPACPCRAAEAQLPLMVRTAVRVLHHVWQWCGSGGARRFLKRAGLLQGHRGGRATELWWSGCLCPRGRCEQLGWGHSVWGGAPCGLSGLTGLGCSDVGGVGAEAGGEDRKGCPGAWGKWPEGGRAPQTGHRTRRGSVRPRGAWGRVLPGRAPWWGSAAHTSRASLQRAHVCPWGNRRTRGLRLGLGDTAGPHCELALSARPQPAACVSGGRVTVEWPRRGRPRGSPR